MIPGTRVIVTRGCHRSKKATVVECPDLQFELTMGGQSCGPPVSIRRLGQSPHIVWIRFDDKAIAGGYWGSGSFEYRQDKLKEFNALDELADV